MIISEKQILQLISIVNAYIATAFRLGAHEREMQEVQELLARLNDQQSEKLMVIE
jgi:hypothetical protein